MSEWINRTKRILEDKGLSDFYPSIHFRESIGSTNEWIREMAIADAPAGTIACADEQTAGKGRRGRTWVSPSGENIYFSLLLRPEFAPEHASALTLVMGLAVAAAIDEVTGLHAGIKWPNDVVLDRRKVCGILTEMKADVGRIRYVVIGTGINVNQTAFDDSIKNMAGSLKLFCGSGDIDRSRLLALVLTHFHGYYERYRQTEDMSLLAGEYNSYLIGINREIRIEDPKGPYIAVSRGITASGGLRAEMPDGTVREIMSGEVSVRGLYGYV